MKVPSCLGLPNGWDSVHDRAIAYLSTHAPLTASGKVPKDEATLERYSVEEMSEFLIAKFPLFRRLKVSVSAGLFIFTASTSPHGTYSPSHHQQTANSYYRRSHPGLLRSAWRCLTWRTMTTSRSHTAATDSRSGDAVSKALIQLYKRQGSKLFDYCGVLNHSTYEFANESLLRIIAAIIKDRTLLHNSRACRLCLRRWGETWFFFRIFVVFAFWLVHSGEHPELVYCIFRTIDGLELDLRYLFKSSVCIWMTTTITNVDECK